MRKPWMLGLGGAIAGSLLAGAAVRFVAASEERPLADASPTAPGVWGLLEELVRTPAHLREQRAGRVADVMRAQRATAPAATPVPRFEILAPMVRVEPVFEPEDAESSSGLAMPADDGLEGLLETYRTLSPAMKARLRGLSDADMVRAVERFAQAERDLTGALGSK